MAGAMLGMLILAAAEVEVAGVAEPEAAVEIEGTVEAEAEEEIVVTATRTERLLRDAPGAVTVIGRERIGEAGGADIGNVVAGAEGVDVLSYGGPGSSSSAHLRGTYGVHTLVLIDGRAQNSPSLGGTDLSVISPVFVERIEIVRGPTSTLYGSGAVGGVIQVLTRDIPNERTSEAELEMGSFGTWSGTASYGEPFEGGGVIVGNHVFHTGGHRDNSECDLAELFFKMGLGDVATGQFLLTAGFKDSRAGWPGPVPAPDPADRSQTQSAFGNNDVSSLVDFGESNRWHVQAEYRWEGLRARASWEQRFDYAHQERIDWLTSDRLVDENEFDTVIPELEVSFSWPLDGALRLHAGAAYKEDRFGVDSTLTDLDAPSVTQSERSDERETGSAWAQIEAGEIWEGVLGVRWDEPSDYDAEPSARILGAWNGPLGLRVEAGFGTAFRAPSLNDLNWPFDGWSEGNPDLKPETAREAELAAKWSPPGKKARVRVAAFVKDVDNLIMWKPEWDVGLMQDVWRPANLNKVEIWGLELAGSAKLGGGFRAELAYTFLDARETGARRVHVDYSAPDPNTFAESTRDLAYTPEHRLRLGVDWSREGLKAGLSVSWVSDVLQYFESWEDVGAVPFTEYDVSYPEKRLPAHWSVGFRFSRSWETGEIFLRVENLLDEEYSTQFGYAFDDEDYPMPGRSITVGTKLRF